MSEQKKPTPAIRGWFTFDPEGATPPALLGTRCATCGTWFFPKETTLCRNPGCGGTVLEERPLSRTGTLWSYTNAGYPPPEPFLPAKLPFEPFAIAAVELAAERLTVLGMVPAGVSPADLRIGATMELVLDTLYEDAEHRYLTWKWKPVQASGQ